MRHFHLLSNGLLPDLLEGLARIQLPHSALETLQAQYQHRDVVQATTNGRLSQSYLDTFGRCDVLIVVEVVHSASEGRALGWRNVVCFTYGGLFANALPDLVNYLFVV